MRKGRDYMVKNTKSKAELLYLRHKLRGGKCTFRALKNKLKNQNNDDNN